MKRIRHTLSPIDAIPDAVLAHVVSWLDLRSYMKMCIVSRHFARLTRLSTTTPFHVSFVANGGSDNNTNNNNNNSNTRSNYSIGVTAWLKRMKPFSVEIDLTAWENPDFHTHMGVEVSATFVRTLCMTGIPPQDPWFWFHMNHAGKLTHLELKLPPRASQTGMERRSHRNLPDEVLTIKSLRSLTCKLMVTSKQIAQLTHLTALDIDRVAHDRYARGEQRYEDGLVKEDAKQLADSGHLLHLCMDRWTERDFRALCHISLSERLQTLRIVASERYTLSQCLPTLLPSLRHFETTWLSDSNAKKLAECAPQLQSLEVRPVSQQRYIDVNVYSDDDEEEEEEENEGEDDDNTTDHSGSSSSIVVTTKCVKRHEVKGILEPLAGLGLIKSISRHLYKLRQLVLRRHHADLRPLSALEFLNSLVCCDRPYIQDATQWPNSLVSLRELRVIDITYAMIGENDTNRHADDSRNTTLRRTLLCTRFPTLAYLSFVSVEDESVNDIGTCANDDIYDPIRRDPNNGYNGYNSLQTLI